MMSALLHEHLGRVGLLSLVASAGTAAELLAPIPGVAEQLYRLGVTLPTYVGRQVDAETAHTADIIVTADPEHVVWIAGRWPDVYPKTYTLPELVSYAEHIGPRQGAPLESWLNHIAQQRPSPRVYLDRKSIEAIADPTGAPEKVWITVADQIDNYCQRLAALLV